LTFGVVTPQWTRYAFQLSIPQSKVAPLEPVDLVIAMTGPWRAQVDEHWGNRQGGLLWELGNELWGDWQIGYPTFGQIAARSLAIHTRGSLRPARTRIISTTGTRNS
jgi:hypothetical protein